MSGPGTAAVVRSTEDRSRNGTSSHASCTSRRRPARGSPDPRRVTARRGGAGAFTFRFTAAGQSRAGALDNPADGVCIDVTASMGGSGRARAARNTTDRTATLYMSIDCEDDGVVLRPGARRSAEFKTVRFG